MGPIATKILAAGRKHQRQQVVDLAMVSEARDRMRDIVDGAKPVSDVAARFPGFAAYIYVTNWALGVVEAAQGMKELARHMDRVAKTEDEYLPEGPPMSPITQSMFWAWA